MKPDLDEGLKRLKFYAENLTKTDTKELLEDGDSDALMNVRESLEPDDRLSEEQRKEISEYDKKLAKIFDNGALELYENRYTEAQVREWWSK